MSGTTNTTASTMLEELRQRIRQEYAPPPASAADRLAAFGRGVLSNRGSFLENLTAGLVSQEQAAAARADQQRRALEMERQVVENATREQIERDRLAQSQSQFEAEGPTREARIRSYNAQAAQAGAVSGIPMLDDNGRVVLINPRTGEVIRETGLRSPQELRNVPRPLTQAQIVNIRRDATRLANTDVGITEGVTPTAAQIARRDELVDQYVRNALSAAAAGVLQLQEGSPTGGASTPQGPQPSRTLQFPRPQQ